jgi:hypothetical protein
LIEAGLGVCSHGEFRRSTGRDVDAKKAMVMTQFVWSRRTFQEVFH